MRVPLSVRAIFDNVATPELFVVALPTAVPFITKFIVLPGMVLPFPGPLDCVRVAVNVTVPP